MKLTDTFKTGTGLYTVQEAAVYARMPVSSLSYWLYGAKNRDALRDAQIPREEGRYVTFVEFVEAVAIRSFRVNYGVPLPRIREAITEAKHQYGIDYPFASKLHRVSAVGKSMVITLQGEVDPYLLTGKNKRQREMKPCIQDYMRDFMWDTKDILVGYRAHQHVTQNRQVIDITMHPRRNFGAPLVGETGYSAETLWRAALAEGDETRAAELYGVDPEAVMAAVRYCEEIKPATL